MTDEASQALRRLMLATILVLVGALPSGVRGQAGLPVFPGAEGFGTTTVAGRGGVVLRVTNLNDSGDGSLRAALDASGPRVVIFEISGTITLTSDDLWIKNPYVTVAGQTAPSPGITIRGGGLRVVTHDVLIQHLRVRPGDVLPATVLPSNSNAFYVLAPAYNVVIDHVSASWATDQNTSTYVGSGTWWGTGLHDVTYSNSLMTEGLAHNHINPTETGSMALLIGEHGPHIAVLRNLMAHNVNRHPTVKGDTTTVIANNLLYNSRDELIDFYDYDGDGPMQSSIVGNVHVRGPDTNPTQPLIFLNQNLKPGTRIYQSDNVTLNPLLANHVRVFDPLVPSPPVSLTGITILPSSQVEAWVKAHAGARPADRDSVDLRIIDEVTNRSGHIISSPSEVGGYPSLAVNVRSLTPPSDPNGDDNADGYTNLEEWLWSFANAVAQERSK